MRTPAYFREKVTPFAIIFISQKLTFFQLAHAIQGLGQRLCWLMDIFGNCQLIIHVCGTHVGHLGTAYPGLALAPAPGPRASGNSWFSFSICGFRLSTCGQEN